MILQELYSKSINRAVNPAVSATKFDPETEQIEIQEYVFTDEIINGLFRILNAIKNNEPYDHVGIWIDGYYGSGKSHFLKYLDYCITPETRDAALSRFLETVKAIDPLDDKHNLCFDYDELFSIANWLKKATIDTCIFNLETSYDNSTDKKKAFLHVFWNEFNGKRGFNKFNITLAQNLEKPLAEKGVFEEFKARIAEEADGADWNDSGIAADIIDNELDWVLDIAKDLAPTLDKESIRERIIKRDTNMSIERFGMELAAYLKDKGEDYRLIFLADEVSQFINKERDRYLNLQEIITKLSEACDNKVWVACTAQQDLSEIMDDCHIADEKDKEGKIKGRFEVKVSLKGTQPEVITQKRILDKKAEVVPVLEEMYEKQKAAFGLQFKLPTSYSSYDSMEDFVAYYPFVPYQFKLIMQVFNSFLNLGYVAKEVKGNERSIIKVIHSTAKANAEAPLGKFISFDELYNNMFEEGLQARGQKAVDNAIHMAREYERNPQLAVRVANILFMICNISQTDQLLFPASIDNITSLLINNVETPRLTIKDEVEKILDFLCQKNIIRLEQGEKGAPDTYSFYSEEEMKVAQLIQSQTPDNNMLAEQFKDIFFKYITDLKNKETYGTRTFPVGASIKQRSFLSNQPDIVVEFAMDMDYDTADALAMNNQKNRLVYYLAPKFHDNKRLFNAFYWYCQVNSYMATPVPNETNRDTRDEFRKRAEIVHNNIVDEFKKLLDSCPIISGNAVIDEIDLGSKRGNERYQIAMQKHLGNIYTKAKLVDNNKYPHTTDQLKRSILRTVQPGEYEGMNAPLTTPENEVEIYLNRQFAEVNVADVLAKFSKEPYGWDNICTLYVINELVRRHNRDYSYMNSPNVETSTVASRIITESNKFTLRMTQAISPEVIQQFTYAWKDIFGTTDVFGTSDSTQLFRMSREQTSEMGLERRLDAYRRIEVQIHQYAFAEPIKKAIHLFEKWLAVRDPLTYFNAVINECENGHIIMDQCKEVVQFTNDFLDKYEGLLQFVKDNEFNFSLIPAEIQGKVRDLKAIVEDQWPVSNLRKYLRLQKEIILALDNVRKTLREQIKEAYNMTYELLENVAKEQGVSPQLLSNKQSVIDVKIAPDNIMVLKANLNTDAFYAQEVQKILQQMPQSNPEPEPGPGPKPGVKDPEEVPTKPVQPKPTEKVCSASLQTKTTSPLHNEAEIDAYLGKLKEQLIKLLEDHDSVMIIK